MNFDTVKKNYNNGKGPWPIALVKIAVQKGIITKDNYKEITGFVYPATKQMFYLVNILMPEKEN